MNRSSSFSFCVSCSLFEVFVDSAVTTLYDISSSLMFPFDDCSTVVKSIVESTVEKLLYFCSAGGVSFSMKDHAMLFENRTV